MNIENTLDKIFEILHNKQLINFEEKSSLEKPVEDEKIENSLKVRKKNGKLTDDILDFLDSYNSAEKNFYNEIYDAILATRHLNPHTRNEYSDYYVDENKHINDFNDLLKKNKENGRLEIFQNKMIFQLGNKGAGKTISQNFWLHNNFKKLEKNKIIYVRLEMSKLYKLWKTIGISRNDIFSSKENNEKRYITIEEYFLGQLLYVFCKRFQELQYIDDTKKTTKYVCAHSELMKEIADKLSNSEENIINQSELTKKELEFYNNPALFFSNKAKQKNYNTVTDFLHGLEEIISIEEHTYKDFGNARLLKSPKREHSYLIDDVFVNKNSPLFKIWIYLGKKIRDFILDNNYHILYIVDGIDNINFLDTQDKDRYDILLNELLDFPIGKKGRENELTLLTMRNSTYEDLKDLSDKDYMPQKNYKNIKNAKRIEQDCNLANQIFLKRVDYIFKKTKWKKNIYMADVLKKITDFHANPIDENKWWNNNFRCFLYNHINLAKYITFRYYWRSNKDRQKIDFNEKEVENAIKSFESINYYLNGELFVKGNEMGDGSSCFNIFGYESKIGELPYYFIYTYICQLLKTKSNLKLDSDKIIDTIRLFGYGRDDILASIKKLKDNGMINQNYNKSRKVFNYSITGKGRFVIEKFYSDIHYLYYSSIFTKIPKNLKDALKYSPNNVSIEQKDRYYPPYCIITGILFLNFLIFEHKKILENQNLRSKLSLLNIDVSVFNLPIEKNNLKNTIKEMLKLVSKQENYVENFTNWMEEI